MVTYKVNGKNVSMFGKVAGANTKKFNRSTKLLSMYEVLNNKLDGMIARGENSMSHTYLCALCVKLLLTTGIRIGNEGSAEGYTTKPHPNSKKEPEFVQTYGLTTMKIDHVTVEKGVVHFNFLGKKQVENTFEIVDKKIVRQIRLLHRERLLNPTDTFFDISVSDLAKFIKKSVGKQFSPKDFRTMRANIFAWEAYRNLPKELPQYKKDLNAEIKSIACYVSEKLNNTIGVCKTSYIDSYLFEYVSDVRYYDVE